MMDARKIVVLIVSMVLLILGLSLTGSFIENLDADEIMVIQSPRGSLTWHTSPGYKWQGFGKVTKYKKRSGYQFETKMRFNDRAHGTLHGSIQYELPLDQTKLTILHSKFNNQESIQEDLIKRVVDKSVYMTGPLMSTTESSAEKRNALIYYIEDQVSGGVYKTRQQEERIEDPLTKEKRTITVVEIEVGKDGMPLRQESAVLEEFGIKTFNFSITSLPYDPEVEEQIRAQQKATMDVQTAIANTKKAEQEALTAAEQGKAAAIRAKWEQEVIKARVVTEAIQKKEVAETEAGQRLAVAKLDAAAAEEYRVMKLRQAEADSTYKRKVIEADGALDPKLEALTRIHAVWAQAYATRQVPKVITGGNGGTGSDSDAATFMDLLTIKAAKDLAIDLDVKP